MGQTLTLTIPAASVTAIAAAGQCVTLARTVGRQVQAAAVGRQAAIAWLAVPVAQNIVIAWSDTCYLYQSSGVVEQGASVVVSNTSTGPAVTGTSASFDGSSFRASAGGMDGQYAIINASGTATVFGLAQQASIDGVATARTPVCAATVLAGQTAWFSLDEGVLVYLSVIAQGGTATLAFPDQALRVTATNATAAFNPGDSSFALVNAP